MKFVELCGLCCRGAGYKECLMLLGIMEYWEDFVETGPFGY